MSDTDRLYALLRDAGPAGVHTLDLRSQGYSGNPSQRATDVEKKYGVTIHRETERRGKRNGSRYTLQGVGKDVDPRGKNRKECFLKAPVVEEVYVSSGEPLEANPPTQVFPASPGSASPSSGELALFSDTTPSAFDPWSEAA